MLLSDENRARRFMDNNKLDYVDYSNQMNCTTLAEDCAEELDLYEDDIVFTIPKWLYSLSAEFGIQHLIGDPPSWVS